ncbi:MULTISPECIES: AAA family ATPase [Vibrio]|uniref:ATPase n=1 Tax=Vibrio aestuarianus TaxID=28171 RepID=A0ABN8TPF8_9VIBR|nr:MULTISPECIES: ATP-binding protein [Vibrio]MCG9691311.1 AAA family ATPase [Vibrio sp. Isolate22]MDE1228574.1 AAA family ATPase [Vibrio aestuarianus]MDE1255138.1 AAA family ATPase [Vibrio aestuarianus]MDH5901327.1 AAA family ATPase [Vibrio aestuarianus]MDH5956268.1 AAA family ATPase [Vibrio aestuarianus]
MLTKIQIKKFKSYQDQELHLSPLTLMIGANASGKSNALEAFRFLAWLAQGQKLSVLKHRVDDSEQILRGQVRDLGYLGSSIFSLGCSTDDTNWNSFDIDISLRDSELHISQETITSPTEGFPLYKIVQPSSGLGTDVRVAYNNFKPGGRKPQISCTDQIAILNQLASSAMFEKGHKKAQQEIPKTTDKFQMLLANTLFLDPVPSLMRDDSHPDAQLRGDCKNLSGVLYRLCQEPEAKMQIVDFVRSLPEQNITDLDFQEGFRGSRLVELVENFGGQERRWAADVLSDGTLRVLAIAAALMSAPEGSTVVIEEVDNGVHPSRAKQLLATMRQQAEKRNVRLLLSTHNPALMDALPDSALGDVVFCYRSQVTGDSQLIRFSDLDDYPGLVSQGPLGELVTNGIVDRFVKSPVNAKQKKQNALDWLAKIRGSEE